MWYSPVDTLNKQRLFNMDIGARGCGKTTGAIRYIIDQHIKNPNYEAVWVRRYKEERNEIEKTFFDGIVNKNFYPNHEFKTRAHIGYMDGVPIIRFAALSVDKRRKGITSPNVRLMVFDEFLLDKGARYIPDEFTAFLSFYDTIARPADPERERVPVLMLANAMTMVNPYFTQWRVMFNEKGQFKTKAVFAQILADDEFYQVSQHSEFAEAIKGTHYYEHSIKNEFLLDNNNFIEQRSTLSRHICNFIFNNKTIGVWIDWNVGKVWLSSKYDPSCRFNFSMGKDGTPNILTAKYFKKSTFYPYISLAFNSGLMFYENLEIKNDWYKINRQINL